LINFLNYFFLNKKFNYFLKKIFKNNEKSDSKSNIVLIEFNAFYNCHLSIFYLAKELSKKFNARTISFFNYYNLSADLIKENFLNKLKWSIGKRLSINFFGTYKAFGCQDIIKPRIISNKIYKAEIILKSILNKLKKKDNLLKIKIYNILIGDLIYDTFLKRYKVATIDLNDTRLKEHILEIIYLFLYWVDYFNKNKVKAIVAVHNCYTYAIIIRIALKRKILVYVTSLYRLTKFTNKDFIEGNNFYQFKKHFNKLDSRIKKNAITFAKKKIEDRIYGGSLHNTKKYTLDNSLYSDSSAFFRGKGKFGKLIKNKNKVNVLICPPDFFDAVHGNKGHLFTDFYEWLNFLGNMSKKLKNYHWYLKTHPNFYFWKKINKNRAPSDIIIENYLKKFPNINLLPNNASHLDLVKQGVNRVLTIYGTVAIEYAYLGVPVITACKNNLYADYKFNLHPKSISEYKNILVNLSKIKININKRDICEYYFMRSYYYDAQWFIDDITDFTNFMKGLFDNQASILIYKYWMKFWNLDWHKKRINILKNFIKSEEKSVNIFHTGNIKLYK
jgi:hypothetical protein